jgi:hypothetical protein
LKTKIGNLELKNLPSGDVILRQFKREGSAEVIDGKLQLNMDKGKEQLEAVLVIPAADREAVINFLAK